MRSFPSVLLVLALATPAAAQVVEAGTSLSAACLGSDGSVCGNGTHPMLALHASWWAGDQVELMARVGRTRLPSRHFTQPFPLPLDVSITDRSRDFVSAMLLYHFRRGATNVRPMIGLGSGAFARAERVACSPSACETSAGLPQSGMHRHWRPDVIVAAGLSGIVAERWVWRGGVITHALANDHNSTIETFVGIGYRFGAR